MKKPATRNVTRNITSCILTLLICVSLTVNSNAQISSILDKINSKEQASALLPVQPVTVAEDNPTCAYLNTLNADSNFAHITTNYEMKLDFTPPAGMSSYSFEDGTSRTVTGPEFSSRSITLTVNNARTNFDWTSTLGISAIIVKGGNQGAYVYPYPQIALSDTGLFTRPNTNGSIPQISHISICYYVPATVTIIKEVQTFNGGNASTQSFPFTTNLSPSNFSLVDNNSQPADRTTYTVLNMFGTGNPISVTESLVQNWSLSDIVCQETAGGGGNGFPNLPNLQNSQTHNLGTRTANIVVEQGENIICKFSNLQVVPTAATASVSGRVLTETGLPLRRAAISVFNANTLETHTVYTNSMGYYRVDGLAVNDFYIVTVSHGKRTFSNNSQSFTLDDNLAEVNFVAVY